MADVIKVKSKKTYEWNQDSKFLYIRVPMPSHTSLKKIEIFLSDLILRVTSLEKKSTHFLDLAQEVDYRSPENKFMLTDGEIHCTLKKKEQVQWEKLLIEDISLADLKTRRRQSEARYEKNVKELQETKDKLRQEYDRKATQEMMRFQQEQRNILQAKKQAQKERAINQVFSGINQTTGQIHHPKTKKLQISNQPSINPRTQVQHQQKKWRQKQQLAMKMIIQQQQKQKNQLKTQKKLQNQKRIVDRVQKEIRTQRPSTSATSNSMFTEDDIQTYDKLREEVGEMQYEEIPIRQANKVEVKFTERVFRHLAARDTYTKEPPMPKNKGNLASTDGDLESKNPLWLKDKGDQFLRDKNYTAAIEAYTEAVGIDGKMVGAWANRSLANLKIFNFNGAINDCEQCLGLMQGKIGASEEDNQKSVDFIVKITTRKAIAKAWRGQLSQSKQLLTQTLQNYPTLPAAITQQIQKSIHTIALRQQSLQTKSKGDEQVKLNQYEQALQYYNQSIAVDQNQYAISNKALCLNKLGNYSQAIDCVNVGVERIAGFNVSTVVGQLNENAMAESKRPQNLMLKLYYRKAKAFEQLGKVKQAEETVHKGLGIDSGDKDFQMLLKEINAMKNKAILKEEKQKAVALIKQGNHAEALKVYAKCLKLIQTADDVQQYLAILQNQCVCYLKLNDYDSIVSTSIRILKLINNIQSKIVEFGSKKATNLSKQEMDKISVRTLMRRANAYLKKEQVYNAKADLQKALQISPKDETIIKQLTKIKELMGI